MATDRQTKSVFPNATVLLGEFGIKSIGKDGEKEQAMGILNVITLAQKIGP